MKTLLQPIGARMIQKGNVLVRYVNAEHYVANEKFLHRRESISVAQTADGRVHAKIATDNGVWQGFVSADAFDALWQRVATAAALDSRGKKGETHLPFDVTVNGPGLLWSVLPCSSNNEKDDYTVETVVAALDDFERRVWDEVDAKEASESL